MARPMSDLFRQDEFWAFLFVLATALLNWPLISLASTGRTIFGVPYMLAYITTIWVLIIAVAYLFDRGYSD